ncbi:MAG: hypothetical protein HQL63_06240 [Magnetococcales bacterium]|nr:hypothetical protein [Magnetococcales bacterium]MBF0321631.1 hypothetical protein [Magnetococcales bacterium]
MTQQSIALDTPERMARLEAQVAQILDGNEFSLLTDSQRKRLIPLVAKRLHRAKRVDAPIITAELYLLRHQAPELFSQASER